MRLTSEDALAKHCPMMRGEDKSESADGFCIAQRCMAWRWAEPMPKKVLMKHREDCSRLQISLLSHAEICPICGAAAVEIDLPEERLGYCGCAGPALY
jgi:hypothetical protein